MLRDPEQPDIKYRVSERTAPPTDKSSHKYDKRVESRTRYGHLPRVTFGDASQFQMLLSSITSYQACLRTPHNTVIADFEYHPRLLSSLKHECVFEIALGNANGDWIVPPTSINHGITISELFQKGVAHLLSSQGKPSQHNHIETIHTNSSH